MTPMIGRRPPRATRLLTTVVGVVAVLIATTSCSLVSGGPSVSFQTEFQEAEKMVAEASAIAGVDVAPVHQNSSGGNIAGAPDPSTQRRDIKVQWVSTDPPPFDAIRDLWTGTFGFVVTSESADSVFLEKGEMRASIGQGLAAADGRRNVSFGVVTGLHPADEVPEPS
jgi:hypothetical protein